MTKFEQVGVNMQYESESKAVAVKKFSQGMNIECDRCSIAIVHRLVVASFEREEA